MSAIQLTPEVVGAADAFQASPEPYLTQVLGVDSLEEYQIKVARTVWENDRTAIAACHDLGKTFLMARLAMTFLNVFPYSKVITTAPTFTQVERILWSEIRAAHAKAKWPLGGKLNLTDWSFGPDWFAIGISPRNEVTGGEGQGTQSSFQGYHAPHIMVLFDEATGISHNIWNMVEGLLTSANVKFVAIGNPTSKESEFYRCFRAKNWAKVYLTCFDSPNLIANGITNKELLKAEVLRVQAMNDAEAVERLRSYKVVRPYLLTLKWVVEQCMRWGFDHPLTVSKIFGEFPDASEKSLVSLGIVEQAQLRVYWPTSSDRKILGVDVARYGADSSVITALHGLKQLSRKEFYKHSIPDVAGEVIALSREIGGADVIVVDETGLGGGVVDLLQDEIGKSLPGNCEVRGIQFGANPGHESDPQLDALKSEYANMKARMFGLLRDDLKRADGLALLNESVYLEELPSINYKYNPKGQLVIESKDDFKKRTGRKSPDSADSLALANFGRYDELQIGKFNKTTKVKAPTLSGGLNAKRTW